MSSHSIASNPTLRIPVFRAKTTGCPVTRAVKFGRIRGVRPDLNRLLKHLEDGGAQAKRRNGLGPTERWFPYYGGYPLSFARGCLEALAPGTDGRVLDPWNGSGTTTTAAALQGVKSVGVDLNPAASLVASARVVHHDEAAACMGVVNRAITEARSASPIRAGEPLLEWLPQTGATHMRGLVESILRITATRNDGVVLDPSRHPLPPLSAFLLLALSRVLRSFAPTNDTTNPAWTRPNRPTRVQRREIDKRFMATVSNMAEEVRTTPTPLTPPTLHVADATTDNVDPHSVDVILTSPPYLTRLDYAVSTRPELALLGQPGGEDFQTFRRGFMGTPLNRRHKPGDPESAWGRTVGRVLCAVRSHPSRDSAGYYYKQTWQYFRDAHLSLSALRRSLRSKGVAVMVVQTSYYKDVFIDLPALYLDMAGNVGLEPVGTFHHDVPAPLANIKPRSMKPLKARQYHESTIVLRG